MRSAGGTEKKSKGEENNTSENKHINKYPIIQHGFNHESPKIYKGCLVSCDGPLTQLFMICLETFQGKGIHFRFGSLLPGFLDYLPKIFT